MLLQSVPRLIQRQYKLFEGWFGIFRQMSIFFVNFFFTAIIFQELRFLSTADFEYCGFWVLRFLSTAVFETAFFEYCGSWVRSYTSLNLPMSLLGTFEKTGAVLRIHFAPDPDPGSDFQNSGSVSCFNCT